MKAMIDGGLKLAQSAALASTSLIGRSMHSLRPTNIVVHRAPPPSPSYKGLELDYENGKKFYFSAEFLRLQSPSADSMRTTATGKRKIVSGRRHVQILGIEPVGNYGIRVKYDDTHDTGIYTWNYLYELGSKKFYYMRTYIQALREEGLSRNPRTTVTRRKQGSDF
ncbi:hypothetical protein R1flu_019210 [Riccia fluitans]|uniref:Gamma-butyrobetaine hydroxylase-like N-terminal domain-containing protein n=1 Tax=Riccia fluitans TaxID=41844 RepID=A0ABD1ZJ27_9MARC